MLGKPGAAHESDQALVTMEKSMAASAMGELLNRVWNCVLETHKMGLSNGVEDERGDSDSHSMLLVAFRWCRRMLAQSVALPQQKKRCM